MLKNIVRALRLPFLTASILPFIFGSLINRANFNISGFLAGFICVAATHLSANLINDYADSKSGLDWQDRNFYKFFGGSKLIQKNIFSERWYLRAAVFFACLSASSVILLAIILNSISVIGLYLVILFLAWSYSTKPLQLSYRGVGEPVIFLLFGPALVMGGYFIQTKVFPDFKSFLLSLPFGFLTSAILFANEIPDFAQDEKIGKSTWVGLLGQQRAFILYYLLISLGFLSIALDIYLGYLHFRASFAFLFIILAIKAAGILKKEYSHKIRLIESSKLTIALHTLVSIALILGVF